MHKSFTAAFYIRLEGARGGALWITQLVDSHRAVLVDMHKQPVQPHHWTCCHPLLDIAGQTRGIGEARDAGVEEGGVVCGHGGAGLADKNSMTEKGLAKLPASRTAYMYGTTAIVILYKSCVSTLHL